MVEVEKVTKSEATRQKLLEAATSLFEEKGFAKATMRLVAERAGVSVGNAYYYFRSKEDLIQGYYASLVEDFRTRLLPALEGTRPFDDRFQIAMKVWLEHVTPHHVIAADLFRFAADPRSPLSPFSKESGDTRALALELWTQVVEGSEKLKVSKELRERLPQLLWLFQMGVTVFWVYDDSPNQSRTKTLVNGATPLITKLLSVSRVPLLRGTVDDALRLMQKLAPAPKAS